MHFWLKEKGMNKKPMNGRVEYESLESGKGKQEKGWKDTQRTEKQEEILRSIAPQGGYSLQQLSIYFVKN